MFSMKLSQFQCTWNLVNSLCRLIMNQLLPIAIIQSSNWPIMNLSYFYNNFNIIILKIFLSKYDLYIVKICFVYSWRIVHIWSTNNLYMDIGRKVWILVLKYTLHCLTHPPPLCFVIQVIFFWIYNNYTNFFYKSNLNIYSFSHVLFKWNKWKFILELFSRVQTYIIKNIKKSQTI
jgi:hypothetical protein